MSIGVGFGNQGYDGEEGVSAKVALGSSRYTRSWGILRD